MAIKIKGTPRPGIDAEAARILAESRARQEAREREAVAASVKSHGHGYSSPQAERAAAIAYFFKHWPGNTPKVY